MCLAHASGSHLSDALWVGPPFQSRGVRISAKRVVERYTTVNGQGVVRVEVRQREASTVTLSPEGLEACRHYLAYPLQRRRTVDEVRVLRSGIVPTHAP